MNKLWSGQKWSATTWNVQLCVRTSFVKGNLLPLSSGSRETRKLRGALGLMKSVIKDGVSTPNAQFAK